MISLRDVLYSFLCLSFALSLAGGKQQHEAGPQIDVIFPFFSSRLPLCGTDFGQVTLCPGCVFKGYRMPYDATVPMLHVLQVVGRLRTTRDSVWMILSWQFLPCTSYFTQPQIWGLKFQRCSVSLVNISRDFKDMNEASSASPTFPIRSDLLLGWRPMLRSGPRILLHVSPCKLLLWQATPLLLGPGLDLMNSEE